MPPFYRPTSEDNPSSKRKKEEKAKFVDATGAGDGHGRRQHTLHMLEGMRRGGVPWQMVHV